MFLSGAGVYLFVAERTGSDEGAALENLRGMTLAELRAAPLSDAAERLRRDYLQLLRVSSLAYGRAADAQTLRAFPMLA